MTEPTPLERLRDAMELVRQASPFLTRVELTQATLDALRAAVEDRITRTLPSTLVSAWGVPLQVADDLPRGAVRLHYSDGRVVTRWRVVMHPKVLQVAVTAGARSVPYGRGRRMEHTLTLMVRRFGWVPAQDPEGRSLTWEWVGERVSAYWPGLAELTKAAGLELTKWQRDYLSALKAAQRAGYRPSVLTVPRNFGRLW